MANPVWRNLLKKIQCEHLLDLLERLSISELNSLFLEIFRRRAVVQTPSSIVNAYRENRFVKPSNVNPIAFLHLELSLLQLAAERQFTPLLLSPLAPLGSCSVIALADQNKIVSSIRGTEVVADATNVLALEAAQKRRASNFDDAIINLCTVHRHVRAQALKGKGFTAHFGVFCAVSSGKDTGHLEFELKVLEKHLSLYHEFLTVKSGLKILITIKVISDTNAALYDSLAQQISKRLAMMNIKIVSVSSVDHRYYSGLRFSIDILDDGKEFNIGDGGFVNWPVTLLSNRKERMLTSGIGIELLYKIKNGLM